MEPRPFPDETAGSWRVRSVRFWRSLGWKGRAFGLLTLVTTIAAIATGLSLAVDLSIDGCRHAGVCEPEPPPVLVGTLTEVRVGAPEITLQEAYDEWAPARRTPTAVKDGQWPGQIITYRVEYEGTHKAFCTVQWTLYDATTGERWLDTEHNWPTRNVPAFPDGKWVKETGGLDANVGRIWVPYVAEGSFLVEVALLNERDQLLDIERSRPFDVTARHLAGSSGTSPEDSGRAVGIGGLDPVWIHDTRSTIGPTHTA